MKTWLPLYLLLVLAATLSPAVGVCGSRHLSVEPRPLDVLVNLALFVPLGVALRERGVVFALIAALLLSAAVEALQLFLPRVASLSDVAANVVGAWLGWMLAPRLSAVATRLGASAARAERPLAIAALLAVAAALLWVGWVRSQPAPAPLSGWEAFPLVLGDEVGGQRQWRGTIAELRVYDRELPEAASAGLGSEAPSWSKGGPVLWLRFAEPRRSRLDGPGGPETFALAPPARPGLALTPEGLRVRNGSWPLPPAVAAHLLARLEATNAFSVVAQLRAEAHPVDGPARILSFSRDIRHRNLMLGQEGPDLVLRVRTPHTSPNATPPSVITRDAPLRGGARTVVASFGGGRARIDVDGRCRAEALYLGAIGPPPLSSELATTVGVVTALGGLGAAGLRGGGRRRRLVALCAGSGLAWLALHWVGAWSTLAGFESIAPWLGAAAAAAAAPLAVRRA